MLSGIRPNGWFTVSLRFPADAVVTAPPQWRQREEHLAALAPRWALAAGIVLVTAIGLVVAVRHAAPSPLRPLVESTVSAAPAPLAPALAAVLAANGRSSPGSAMATLMDLAERGVLVIRELPRRFGVSDSSSSARCQAATTSRRTRKRPSRSRSPTAPIPSRCRRLGRGSCAARDAFRQRSRVS